jgi:hypothetical protein
MKKIIDLSNEDAKAHFLKGKSYFNNDLPPYLSFEPILKDVATELSDKKFNEYQSSRPSYLPKVNYSFLTNKDGKFAWRPLELIHPVVYVSLVNVICQPENWEIIRKLLSKKNGAVDCCSIPVLSDDRQEKDVASQIKSWWINVEQRSLSYSLDYSHLLYTDVVDCYGSLYTHSIPWAIHGIKETKKKGDDKSLLGNQIDFHIQAGRYGQTNGIPQGSVLMDLIAEIVLSYVDEEINKKLSKFSDFRIIRYRDDYRIFTNNDSIAEEILKVVSTELLSVGMKLGVSKTILNRNVVEGSIKQDKLAGIDLQDLGNTNAKTIQKQLLRLHSFGQKYPNSGALKRLVSEFHMSITGQTEKPDDLEVQVAIATDIGFVSPSTFPAIAGILSQLIGLAPETDKPHLCDKVREKMRRVPYNGYLEMWLQRVTHPIGVSFDSEEPICRIVNKETMDLWENSWIAKKGLKKALHTSKIVDNKSLKALPPLMGPEETIIFTEKAWSY